MENAPPVQDRVGSLSMLPRFDLAHFASTLTRRSRRTLAPTISSTGRRSPLRILRILNLHFFVIDDVLATRIFFRDSEVAARRLKNVSAFSSVELFAEKGPCLF